MGAIGQIRTVLDARPTFGVHVRILGDFCFTIYTSKLWSFPYFPDSVRKQYLNVKSIPPYRYSLRSAMYLRLWPSVLQPTLTNNISAAAQSLSTAEDDKHLLKNSVSANGTPSFKELIF